MTDVTPQEHAYDEWCATIPGEFFVPHIAEAFEAGWNAAFDHTRPASTEPADALAEAREAMDDALAGWRYIRATHGDLYGVGWDRVEARLTAALSRLNEGEVK